MPVIKADNKGEAMVPYSRAGTGVVTTIYGQQVVDCGSEGWWPTDKLKWIPSTVDAIRWNISATCEAAVKRCGGYFQITLKEL